MTLPTHQKPVSTGSSDSSSTDLSGFLTRPVVLILFLLCVLVYYSLPSRNGDYTGSELGEEELRKRSEARLNEWEKKKRDEERNEREVKNFQSTNELVLGAKRYKLYEKKRLNFKKAEAYCKKNGGQLARTENVDEMQRLQYLLTKARSVSDEMWIGVDKKKWKKHSTKMQDHPAGINPDALNGMGAMMMGGGGNQQMCPSLSSSTRSLAPTMCLTELPFICEFDKNVKPKTSQASKGEKDFKKMLGERNRRGRGRKPSAKPKRMRARSIRDEM